MIDGMQTPANGATNKAPLSAHEQVVDAIQNAIKQEGGEVRLIARVNDVAIGNTSDNEVYFFVPDLHLVTSAVRQRYSFGFNYESTGVLARILTELATLKSTWKTAQTHKLVTIQLGDFIDLWREGSLDIPSEAHGNLRDVLYRDDQLNATLILGNHDTLGGQPLDDMPFVLKAFNRPPEGDKPFLFVTHGDAFDLLEGTMPDRIQEFGVYYFAPLVQTTTYPLSYWANLGEQSNPPAQTMRDAIQKQVHDLTADTTGSVPICFGHEKDLPELLAETISAPQNATHTFFPPFYESVGHAEAQSFAADLRVAVIGHTHHARMVFCKPPNGGRPLLLMDCGSWIEQCTYHFGGSTVTEPNAQFGVIHGNDARIYQIHIKPT